MIPVDENIQPLFGGLEPAMGKQPQNRQHERLDDNQDGPQPGWTQRLLDFYLADHRDLPWRRTRDPYAIYVSEIMLQQTQVQTVIPYYERFLARFPDAAALAAADEDELHRYWAGLGYYARARQMQRAAARMVECHGGQLPDDPELLLQLPGIGRYTVGAIRSIAFGHPEPAVDGNVVRVIARLYALPLVQGDVSDRARVAALLQPQIPTDQPGDFNQALMELGARICVPSRPRCLQCPIRDDCQAFREGRTGELPLKQPRKAVPEEPLTLVVLQLGPWFHVERRNGTLLKGLYQFDLLPGHLDAAAVTHWLRGFPGLRDRRYMLTPLPERLHRFTHRLWNLRGYWCRINLPDDIARTAAADLLTLADGVTDDPAVGDPDAADDPTVGDPAAVGDSAIGHPMLVSQTELAALPFPTALATYRTDVLESESCNDGF